MNAFDPTHPTVAALTQLIPNATVLGGSFLSRLPRASSIDAETRGKVLRETRASVVDEVLAALAYRATGRKQVIPRTRAGARAWPKGYVGSVTHKGTIVLAAMAPNKWMRSLGIDLERHEAGSLLTLASVLDQNGTAGGNELFLTFAFSAKEAVFKAQFPLTEAPLEFVEVTLEWQRLDPSFFQAKAYTKDLELDVRGCVPIEPWVVAVAGQVV